MKRRLVPLLLLIFLVSGCTTVYLIRSSWNSNAIAIDGKESDWNDRIVYLNDEQLSIGVSNDTASLCLFIKTVDRRQIRQIRLNGLTAWIDPSGGDDKVFGIRIPGKPMRPGEMSEGLEGEPEDPIDEIELLRGEKETPVRIPAAQLHGIEIGHGMSIDGSFFEFRIPFHVPVEGGPVVDLSGDELGIGFEGGSFQSRRGEEQRPHPGGFDGEEPGADMRPLGRRGERPEGRPMEDRPTVRSLEPLNFWFKIRLSKPLPGLK